MRLGPFGSFLAGIAVAGAFNVASDALLVKDSSAGARFHEAELGNRVAAACKPGRVSDWHVDYTEPALLQVTCYRPKSSEVWTTVVER